MNRIIRIALLLLALAGIGGMPAAAPPAFAQEKMQDEAARSEFIYRVNLGRADDVRLLMRQGASPNQLNGEGVPVICLAAGRIDPEGVNIIQALLSAGANINARDRKGQTPLFYAAKAGNLESLLYLLESGIDSYALDNNGDVARTAAYKAGQTDSVETIDDFILKQTAEITQAYKDQSRRAARGGPNPGHARAKGGAAEPPAPEEETPAAPETPAPEESAPAAGQQEAARLAEIPPGTDAPEPEEIALPEPAEEEEAVAEEGAVAEETAASETEEAPAAESAGEESGEGKETAEERERRKEESKRVIYDMAFNVCAFQYWAYCSSAKQSVDLDREELVVAVESSKTAAENLKNELIHEYHILPNAVEAISSSAQRRIYKELNTMASNRDRHEKGVGKRDDMQQRCEFIARQWGVRAPDRLTNPDSGGKGKGASSKGGSSGGGMQGVSKSTKSRSKSGKGGKAKKKSGKGSKSKKKK